MRYTAMIEKAGRNVSAYLPDLRGCIVTAASVAAVERKVLKAIQFHLESVSVDGVAVSEPKHKTIIVDRSRS